MTNETETLGGGNGPDGLDRRARAATAALRAQIAQLVDDDSGRTALNGGAMETLPADASGNGEHPPEPAEPYVIPLSRGGGRDGGPDGRRRRRRRMTLAVAAVVAMLAAIGGVLALGDDGDRPDVASGDRGNALVPGWLPAGLEPLVALDLSTADVAGFLAGETVVYGDQDAADPWASTLAATRFVIPEDMVGDWQADEGEPVTVAGHDATVSQIDGRDSGSRAPGWQVQWPVDDGMLAVAGTNTTRDEVLTAAAGVTDDLGIGSDGLPAGFTELARGPLDAAAPGLTFTYPPAGLALTYTMPAEGDDVRTQISIIQRAAPGSAVDLLRASADSEAITVRGNHGVLSRDDAVGLVLQWAEPDGRLVTVVAGGVTEQVALQVAERMRPADAGELEALLADHAPPPHGEFDDVPAGQVEVASGEVAGDGRWRVVADPTAGEVMSALISEQVSTDGGSSGSTSASVTAGDAPPPLELSSDSIDGGGTVVYGLVAADADTVTLESPGQAPVPLDLHTVEGWDHRVVASLVPLSGSEAVAIARTADGRELGRTIVYIGGPEPLTPGPGGAAATEEVVVGTEEACVTGPGPVITCAGEETTLATIPGDG